MRVLRFLRSRRLAIILLVGLTVYAWVTTLVPLESVNPALVAQWDAQHPSLAVLVGLLGLHDAYSSPVFLLAALLIALSTAACSWERTSWAVRVLRARGVASGSSIRRLTDAPTFVISDGVPSERDEALDVAVRRLESMKLRVRSGSVLVEGSSGNWGYLGSPLFHWALVGLFLFAALGQFMKYEGNTNIVVGNTVLDGPGAYAARLDPGPLALAYSGLGITVDELDLDFSADGVARGATPHVTLSDAGTPLKAQWVYPNNPLRYGSLLVHSVSVGAAFVGTVSVEQTGERQQVVLYFDPAKPSPGTFELPHPDTGDIIGVAITPATGQRVNVSVRSGSQTTTRTAAAGETALLSDGVTLRVDRLTEYAQLKVVNDPTVYLIYAMFGLICIGAALTVFVMPRMVRVLAVDGPQGTVRLHVLVSQRASDPAFRGRVERAMAIHGAPEESLSDDKEQR